MGLPGQRQFRNRFRRSQLPQQLQQQNQNGAQQRGRSRSRGRAGARSRSRSNLRRSNSQSNLKRSNSQSNLRRANSRQNLGPQRVRLNRQNFRQQNTQQRGRGRSLSRTNSRQNLSVNSRLGTNKPNAPLRRRNRRFGNGTQLNNPRGSGILRGKIIKRRNNNQVAPRNAAGPRGRIGQAKR